MLSYKIIVEDMNNNACAREIRRALEAEGAAVTVNLPRKEIIIDSDLEVEDIYAIIEEAGYTPTDLELV